DLPPALVRRPDHHGRARPSSCRRGTMCRCRCQTDCVASLPAEVMMLNGGRAISAARAIASPATCGDSLASCTCTRGITSTCPSVTGFSGTIATASAHWRTNVAGARPATISQNTHGSGIVGLLCDGQVRGEPPNGGHDVVRLRRRQVRRQAGEVLHPRPGGGEEGVQRVPGGGVAVGVVPLIPRLRVGLAFLGEGVEGLVSHG